MKFRLYLPLLIVPVVLVWFFSCNLSKPAAVSMDVSAEAFDKLSDYHFYAGNISDLKPNARLVPYELNTPLFSDYAYKARFVYVPEGKAAQYDTTKSLDFPVGSCLVKNFYYPADFREKNGARKIIETRLLVHREKGWEALTYVWNDEQ